MHLVQPINKVLVRKSANSVNPNMGLPRYQYLPSDLGTYHNHINRNQHRIRNILITIIGPNMPDLLCQRDIDYIVYHTNTLCPRTNSPRCNLAIPTMSTTIQHSRTLAHYLCNNQICIVGMTLVRFCRSLRLLILEFFIHSSCQFLSNGK